MSIAPTWHIDIAFENIMANLFTIGEDEIGPGSYIGGDLIGEIWTDVTGDTTSFTVRRGRDDEMMSMLAGSCRLALTDPEAKYNPENAASIYAGDLVPFRPVRIRATHPDGTTYYLFYGFVLSIEHFSSPGYKETVFDCTDLFEWLVASNPVVSTMANTTVGGAIGALLDEVNWVNLAARDIDSGRAIINYTTNGENDTLTYLDEVLPLDGGGMTFVSKSGVMTFRDAETLYQGRSPVATWTSDSIQQARHASLLSQIINRQTITKTGNTPQVVDNAASQALYAVREGAEVDSAFLVDDAEALLLAQWTVASRHSPKGPARGVKFSNATASDLTQQLARELGDCVHIDETVSGSDIKGLIQGITHDVRNGGEQIITQYVVAKTTVSFFTIGFGIIGVDVLAF